MAVRLTVGRAGAAPACQAGRMANTPVDLAEKLSAFTEPWSPKVVARLNDYEVKVVKLAGEFVWHAHDDTDELFLVLAGTLTIRLAGR